jgi:hypothetical protein
MSEKEFNPPFGENCAEWELRDVHEWTWRESNHSIHAGDCPKFGASKGEPLPDTVVRELWRMYQMTGAVSATLGNKMPRDIGFFNCGNGQCTTVRGSRPAPGHN